MADHFILLLALLLFSWASNATQQPRTLHLSVVHRDAVFPPPPDAQRHSLLSHRLAADAARYAALTSLGNLLRLECGEYLALVGVGTPPTGAPLFIDSGSDLVWLQCKPCRHCYQQASPIYDPRGSSTYRQIPCSSPHCPHRLQLRGWYELVDAFDARAAEAGMRRLDSDLFDACYEGTGTCNHVPRISLHLAGGADMVLPRENYLVPMGDGRDCLALQASADHGLSVLGNVQQQGYRVVFDVDKERIDFVPNGCPL